MYKRILSTLSIVCALVVIASSCLSASASTKVNGVSVNKGDEITFTINIRPIDVKVAAFNLRIDYDGSVLEVQKDTVETPAFEGRAVCNVDMKNVIYANAVDGINGFEITEDSQMIKITFKVIKDASDCDISYEMLELFDLDLEEIDPTEYTYCQVETAQATSSEYQPNFAEGNDSSLSSPTSKQSQANSNLINSATPSKTEVETTK